MPVNLQLPEIGRGGLDADTMFRIAALLEAEHERQLKYGTPAVPGKLVKGTPGSVAHDYSSPIGPEPLLSPAQFNTPAGPPNLMQAGTPTSYKVDPLFAGMRGYSETGIGTPGGGSVYAKPGTPDVVEPRPQGQWMEAQPAKTMAGVSAMRPYTPETPDRIVGGKPGTLGSQEMNRRAWAFKALQETDGISEDVRKEATSILSTEKDYATALNKLNGILQKKDAVTLSEPVARMWNLMTVYKKGEAPFYEAGDKMTADEFAKTNSVFSTWAYSKTADANEQNRKMNAVRYLKALEELKAAKAASGIVVDIEQKVKSRGQADPYADPLMQGNIPTIAEFQKYKTNRLTDPNTGRSYILTLAGQVQEER